MLDHGIVAHATCFDWVDTPLQNPFDGTYYEDKVLKGVMRRPKVSEPLQSNRDAIYTIGRLIREKHLKAYSYTELAAESVRGYYGAKPLNALQDCSILSAEPPINRGTFFNYGWDGFVRKGGRKDRSTNNIGGSQVEFLSWVISLGEADVESIISLYGHQVLSDFEIQSLRELDWFRRFAKRFRSSENYPDAFHVWATKRNKLNCFLTLDFKLINTVRQIKKERQGPQLETLVISPLELLEELGVSKPDIVPYVFDRFYPMVEIPNLL